MKIRNRELRNWIQFPTGFKQSNIGLKQTNIAFKHAVLWRKKFRPYLQKSFKTCLGSDLKGGISFIRVCPQEYKSEDWFLDFLT